MSAGQNLPLPCRTLERAHCLLLLRCLLRIQAWCSALSTTKRRAWFVLLLSPLSAIRVPPVARGLGCAADWCLLALSERKLVSPCPSCLLPCSAPQETIELPTSVHPFFFATQFHPEFKSNPLKPSPPFLGFIQVRSDSSLFGRALLADPLIICCEQASAKKFVRREAKESKGKNGSPKCGESKESKQDGGQGSPAKEGSPAAASPKDTAAAAAASPAAAAAGGAGAAGAAKLPAAAAGSS